MKNLFFVAVAIGILSGTSISSQAQTSVNLESLADKTKSKISLKFIEGVEITPERIPVDMPADNVIENKRTSGVVTTAGISSIATIEQCSALQFKYALLMDREVESFTNTSLYNFIDDWWATRYRYGGTNKKGIDCSAFTSNLLSSVYGIDAPRTAAEQYSLAEKIATEDIVEGDLVFFNTRGGVSHVGIYLGDNYFVHSSLHEGVTISSLTDDYYSRKFIGGGRICK